mgnify:CR=1 FL=1
MSWNSLNNEDVLAEFNPLEKAAFDDLQSPGGQSMLGGIVDNAVERVRAAIRAGGYSLGPESTLPDGVRGEAIAIVRWRFLLAIPKAEALQTKERQSMYEDALKLLDKIADGKFRTEDPPAPVDATSLAPAPQFTEKTRNWTAARQDGI